MIFHSGDVLFHSILHRQNDKKFQKSFEPKNHLWTLGKKTNRQRPIKNLFYLLGYFIAANILTLLVGQTLIDAYELGTEYNVCCFKGCQQRINRIMPTTTLPFYL